MDIYTPEYSLKNIPYPSYHVFRLALTEKIVDFVKRLWWKAFFYLDSCENNDYEKKKKKKRFITSNPKILLQIIGYWTRLKRAYLN